MRMQDRIGTLERGKLADLVVVNGDPLRDIGVLQDRQRLSVMKGGRFVTQHLS
jgi:imidazolonepropionase-like amidohydrolase